jgi:lipopolysaccharide biosynthesis protein
LVMKLPLRFLPDSVKMPVRRALIYIDRHFSRKIKSDQLILTVDHSYSQKSPERKESLCLYAHYDPQNRVDPYVFFHLRALSQAGFDIVFSSTCSTLRAVDYQALLHLCRTIITRTNRSIDFGSWKTAFDLSSDWSQYKFLLFTNDSVFGPMTDLGLVLGRLYSSPADLWGMTDSYQYSHHLQSYFLLFKINDRTKVFLRSFWNGFVFLKYKKHIILEYELGYSAQASKAGLLWKPLCDYGDMARHFEPYDWNQEALPVNLRNPSHAFWKTLIFHGGCPYIKRELLLKNPSQIPTVHEWKEVVQRVTEDYPPDLIQEYLDRIRNVGF